MKISRYINQTIKKLIPVCMSVVALSLTTGCIDEDLSDCGSDFALDYSMKLKLTLRQELDDKLTTPSEQHLSSQLKDELGAILSNRAQWMNLSFFKIPEGFLKKRDIIEPNADQMSVTIYLRKDHFHNYAIATTARQSGLQVTQGNEINTLTVEQGHADTLDAHKAALYVGDLEMNLALEDTTFFVPLYMQNAVPVVVIDRDSTSAQLVKAYAHGMANAFRCADSTYIYTQLTSPATKANVPARAATESTSVMRMKRIDLGGLTSFYTVCFPSKPGKAADAPDDKGIWSMDVYAQTANGKYVKNTIEIKSPILAAEIKVFKAKLKDDGTLVVGDDTNMGVSVELDWKPGGEFDVEI